MNTSDYRATLLVDKTPEEVINAINNIRGWWSEEMEGSAEKSNDVFTVRFGEVYITMKIVELIPGQKIVWQVIDCNKPWLKNKKEWNGTKISFEVSKKDDKTQIRFAHLGLVPEVECFEVCSNAWTDYLQGSLFKLVTTGKGKPTPMKKTANAK